MDWFIIYIVSPILIMYLATSGLLLLCKIVRNKLPTDSILIEFSVLKHIWKFIENNFKYFIVGSFILLFLFYKAGFEKILFFIPDGWGQYNEYEEWLSTKSVISSILAIMLSFITLFDDKSWNK